jgi:DUF4097 and DUF4098 domain-containing protein YvlB
VTTLSSPDQTRASRPADRPRLTPGRGVALVLGVPVVLTLIAAGGYSVVQNLGRASFPVRYQVPVSRSGLTMSVGGGNVTVRGDAPSAGVAQVSGTVSYDLARPTVRHDASGISLDCPRIDLGNCNLSAAVDVAASTAVKLTTGGGDLSVSGVSGVVSASTGGGNVTATGLSGVVTLSTGGGDMTVSQLSGPVSLHTDGGNITGTGITSTQVSAATGGGDITLTLTRVPHDLTVNTDGGNITIVVPPAPGGYYVTKTTDGGNLDGNLQSTPDATDKITAHSGGGDITIDQS